jgi:hypothetical protein
LKEKMEDQNSTNTMWEGRMVLIAIGNAGIHIRSASRRDGMFCVHLRRHFLRLILIHRLVSSHIRNISPSR